MMVSTTNWLLGILGLAVVLQSALLDRKAALAADEKAVSNKKPVSDRERIESLIPKSKSVIDDRTFIVYSFSRKGRYFTTGKKYNWIATTSRSRAVDTYVRWRQAGFGVHVMWNTKRNHSNDAIEKWVADSYEKHYGKGAKARPKAPQKTADVSETVWKDVRSGDRFWFSKNGRLESGDSAKGVSSNDRGSWTQSGSSITIRLRGSNETWTRNGDTLIYGLRKLVRVK